MITWIGLGLLLVIFVVFTYFILPFFLWFYLTGIICIVAFIAIGLEGYKEDQVRKQRKWHRQYICRRYRNAYLEYWGKSELANSVFRKYAKTILSDNCEEWTDSEWEILEKELINREKEEKRHKVREEIDSKLSLLAEYNNIMSNCPHGYREYVKRFPDSTVEDVAQNGYQIRKLESDYLKEQKRNGWH